VVPHARTTHWHAARGAAWAARRRRPGPPRRRPGVAALRLPRPAGLSGHVTRDCSRPVAVRLPRSQDCLLLMWLMRPPAFRVQRWREGRPRPDKRSPLSGGNRWDQPQGSLIVAVTNRQPLADVRLSRLRSRHQSSISSAAAALPRPLPPSGHLGASGAWGGRRLGCLWAPQPPRRCPARRETRRMAACACTAARPARRACTHGRHAAPHAPARQRPRRLSCLALPCARALLTALVLCSLRSCSAHCARALLIALVLCSLRSCSARARALLIALVLCSLRSCSAHCARALLALVLCSLRPGKTASPPRAPGCGYGGRF
jgi:hypothetical protein